MLNWFKRLLGVAPVQVTTEPVVEQAKEPAKPKAKAKKPAAKKAAPKKKAAKVDLAAMKKDELLAHAKKVGAKANASMKKDDIIAAIGAS